MRAVVQRVNFAFVRIEDKVESSIGQGLLILIGIGNQDGLEDVIWMAEKILNLRIFSDENEKLNLSIQDVKGEILVVSQFTLYGDCRKGRRPSYSEAASPDAAKAIYERFVEKLKESGLVVKTGVFQASMKVNLENDGPVTLLLDSEKEF